MFGGRVELQKGIAEAGLLWVNAGSRCVWLLLDVVKEAGRVRPRTGEEGPASLSGQFAAANLESAV